MTGLFVYNSAQSPQCVQWGQSRNHPTTYTTNANRRQTRRITHSALVGTLNQLSSHIITRFSNQSCNPFSRAYHHPSKPKSEDINLRIPLHKLNT